MRQWKIAMSLAVVGATAAPFITGAWQHPISRTNWISITQDQAAKATAFVRATNNCQHFDDPQQYDQIVCHVLADQLRNGGEYSTIGVRREYWIANAAVSLAAFVIIFGLVMILPIVARRYSGWLKT
jgi:hypothetical protein